MFKFLEFITAAIAWLYIVLSPFSIGLLAGAAVYYSDSSPMRLALGIAIAFAGLVTGVVWAIKASGGKGTIWLISRYRATPELDHPDENHKKGSENNMKSEH